jgi:hypothetical protein
MHVLIKRLMRRTADDLIEIGNALIGQNAQHPHMSIRTAQRCMNVASEFGAKYAAAAHLGVLALDMLASAEPEVQAELKRRIAAGDILTAADVNPMVVR